MHYPAFKQAIRRAAASLGLLLTWGGLVLADPAAAGSFTDHGVAARVSESRGMIAAEDARGNRLILALAMDRYAAAAGALRTSLLVIDAATGKTEQFWHPREDSPNGAAYALLKASTGRLYTTFGSEFVEFDVDARQWRFTQTAGTAMSFAEAPDGRIYFATYPTSTLFSYDPQSRRLTSHGRLDPQEQYPSFLAVDDEGWVYAGIGTARSNLVAFHPKTGERRQLVAEAERRTGSGSVYIGIDGNVYGRGYPNGPVYRLQGGVAHPSAAIPPAEGAGGISWGSSQPRFPSGGRVIDFNLPERRARVANPDGTTVEITFDYASDGSEITRLVAGPDGRIYGSTSHPMHFIVFDPATQSLEDWGHIERIGGGNFPGMAAQGRYVVGGAYANGSLYAYDTTQPWNVSPIPSRSNPRLLAEYPGPISRPRTVHAYPDGKTVIMGGFAGYGLVGGGLAIYDLEENRGRLIPNHQFIPGHSAVTLRTLPTGELIGGTSVEAPGGGHPVATVAKLFIFDLATDTVVFEMEPVPDRTVFGTARLPGEREVVSLEVRDDGLVYGLTGGSQFFVFDPQRREVIHRANVSTWGSPVRTDQSFVKAPSGEIYAVLSRGILRVDPDTFAFEPIATPPTPITAGLALVDGVLYFASGSHFWSYRLEP